MFVFLGRSRGDLEVQPELKSIIIIIRIKKIYVSGIILDFFIV